MSNSEDFFTGERFVPGIDDAQLEVEHYQRYNCVLPLVKNKIVLDAACGEGYGSAIMAGVAKQVIGVDVNKEAIERAGKQYSNYRNLNFLEESVGALSLKDKSVDVVVSFETIEHISEVLQQQFLDQISKILKEDGILVMSTPNKAVYSDLRKYHNEFHVKEFYKNEFLDFLHQKFEYVILYNQYFEVTSVIDRPVEKQGMVGYCREKAESAEGKYYIAVASNMPLPDIDISHIYMNKYPEYESRITRILELQDEVEVRNKHMAELDSEIEEYRRQISSLSNAKESLEDKLKTGEQKRQKLQTEISALKEEYRERINILKRDRERLEDTLEDKQEELQKLQGNVACLQTEIIDLNENTQRQLKEFKQQLANKEGHIEQLLESEREYEREKASKTYRLALAFRKMSTFILPVNSKRRFFAAIFMKAVRHPGLVLKMLNPRRIKNCFTILKTEGIESAFKHLQLVEEYERSREVSVDTEKLSVIPVSEKEKSLEDYERLVFPQWEEPEVSIIIPVYNQFDYTWHCLQSILKNSEECSYEIIIGNDCSTDLTARIEEIVSGIKVITHEKNLRFLLNCNKAAEAARGKYLLFLNNDTQVQQGWLKPLIALMERDQKIGMTGSKLLYADGYLQEAGGILWKDASAWNYGNRQNPNDAEFNYVREADYISGAAIMIRTELWKEIGGFDTRYVPAYCEDSDLAFEVRRHGYQVVYQPKSVVVHFEGISNGTDLNAGQKKYQVDNQKKFYDKWKSELEQYHFENGTNVMLARERSRNRKHVLVIDHYVPQYDKDAGSKTTFMYLKMLVQKGYQITFLGDNFYQHEPYTTELQQMGIFVLYGPKYAEHWKEWLRENIDCFDVFYLNRPHISMKYIDFIREHGKGRIIYYGHDLHFLRIQREYELTGAKELLEEAQKWKEQELYLMRKADMVYYPSETEQREINRIDASIPVKAITAYVYEQFHHVTYNMTERQGMLFVGGFGHGPNLDAVKWFLDKIFPQVYEKIKAPFYIVGSKAPDEITQIDTEGVIVKGFVSEEELQCLYHSCRMAVVPLRYGAGVKGKVVEALYYGIPVITTSVGAEGIGGIEEIAVVRDCEEELIQAICEVYDDEAALSEMSSKSQEYAQKYFSTEAVWNVVKEDFE